MEFNKYIFFAMVWFMQHTHSTIIMLVSLLRWDVSTTWIIHAKLWSCPDHWWGKKGPINDAKKEVDYKVKFDGKWSC